MEFLVMLLAGFDWDINPMVGCGISSNATSWIHWEINPVDECRISSNATAWIVVWKKSHGQTWNFQ